MIAILFFRWNVFQRKNKIIRTLVSKKIECNDIKNKKDQYFETNAGLFWGLCTQTRCLPEIKTKLLQKIILLSRIPYCNYFCAFR
uniref:hypothetical protein n=1 Tax=Streptococcus dysgalactiae TaxID=1334 RepID=UPI00159ECA61|nr:hypothetical protein [Streptococcus dysgalactiae]